MQKKYRSIDFPLYGIGKGWGFFQLLMASTLDGVGCRRKLFHFTLRAPSRGRSAPFSALLCQKIILRNQWRKNASALDFWNGSRTCQTAFIHGTGCGFIQLRVGEIVKYDFFLSGTFCCRRRRCEVRFFLSETFCCRRRRRSGHDSGGRSVAAGLAESPVLEQR